MRGKIFKRQLLASLLAAYFIPAVVFAAAIRLDSPANQELPRPVANGGISFNFQNISTRTLLQVIAQNSGNNFVISGSVKGEMTLFLQNVTWEQALDVILKANGLGYRRFGNTLLIAPVDELASNEIKKLNADQQLADLSPLTSTILRLKYANASDLAGILKSQQNSLLSPKGQLGVDPRTNSLWVRDTQQNLSEIRKFASQLDIPAKQVLIEARVVTIDTTYESEIGVRFGLNKPNQHVAGSLEGGTQAATGTPVGSELLTDRLNFALPAGVINSTANPARFALALAKIDNAFLDLELSALEGEGHSEIISTPRVITSNQQKATIETGEEIPYQESTSSGATSIAFKKAVLSLEIVPQITPDNKIILNIKVNQDKRGQGSTNPLIPPAIDTQQVQSQIALNNNETVVVGGVYKVTKIDSVERIPFLGKIPVFGQLFRHNGESNERNELLIFITPKIVNSASTIAEGHKH